MCDKNVIVEYTRGNPVYNSRSQMTTLTVHWTGTRVPRVSIPMLSLRVGREVPGKRHGVLEGG